MSIFKCLIFILSIFSVQINGKPLLLSINYCNCTVNPEYADPPICYFNGTSNPSRGHVEIQMHREVKVQNYELDVYLIKNKRKRHMLHLKKSSCEFFEGRVTAILKIFKKIIDDYGKMPQKCPVEKDFRYYYNDIVIDSNRLPPLIFDGDFHLITTNTEKNKFIFSIEIKGSIRSNYDFINVDKTVKV